MRRSTLFLALALALGHACALAASPVVVGFDNGSPPFFDAKRGKAAGIYPILVAAVFKDAKVPMRAVPAPFVRVLEQVDRGAWGAGGILKTGERLRKYDYSDYIFVESIVVYYNRHHPVNVARLADLHGKRIGILRGWSYGEAFDATAKDLDVKVLVAASDARNFDKLQAGGVDAVFALEETGAHMLASGAYPDVMRSTLFVRQNPSYIAFNKQAGRRPLLKKLNKSIARLRSSGQLSTLVTQYLQTTPP